MQDRNRYLDGCTANPLHHQAIDQFHSEFHQPLASLARIPLDGICFLRRPPEVALHNYVARWLPSQCHACECSSGFHSRNQIQVLLGRPASHQVCPNCQPLGPPVTPVTSLPCSAASVRIAAAVSVSPNTSDSGFLKWKRHGGVTGLIVQVEDAITAQNLVNVVLQFGEKFLGLRAPVVSWELVETIFGKTERLLLQPNRERRSATGCCHVEPLSVTLQSAVWICGQCQPLVSNHMSVLCGGSCQ